MAPVEPTADDQFLADLETLAGLEPLVVDDPHSEDAYGQGTHAPDEAPA